jgi:autotransporter family porin
LLLRIHLVIYIFMMMNKYNKGRLLVFFTLIALLSACGGSPTAKTGTTPTPFKKTSGSSTPAILGQHLTATAQAATATAAPTPTPIPAPTRPVTLPTSPTGGGRFVTLPPGSALPGDAECAARVSRSSWEPRSDNATANNTNVYAQGNRLTGSYLNQYGYEQRVTGNFTGTTDEILQWSACKWGIDENIVRAQAVQEGYWHQSTLGDCRGGTVSATHGCQSVGILQVKGADIPATHPGTWPYAYESTAFNADYTYAIWRACFEGKEDWLGNGYHAGDQWGCVGRWFSGDWYEGSPDYIASVQNHMANKDWLQSGF